MRTGSLLEVAVVLKSLVLLSRSKPLLFREKKMLERAKIPPGERNGYRATPVRKTPKAWWSSRWPRPSCSSR